MLNRNAYGTADELPLDEAPVKANGKHGREEANPLRIINPADWDGEPVPPRESIVEDFVPAKTVSMLVGDGAAGKSTLALQLCSTRALKTSWLNTVPVPGRSLYLSAEDDGDELHRRMDAIRAHYGASFAELSDMRLVDLVGEDAVLGQLAQSGAIQATVLLSAVLAYVREFQPDLVVVDALADAFAGDENNRAQARQFINLLKRPCREYQCAFLCLAHPSLNGMATGRGTSGSTAWSNSVRSRMYFETAKASDDTEPDPDLRKLTVMKANYAPAGKSVTVRWKNGVYVPESGLSLLDKVAHQKKVDDTFVSLLRQFNAQGQRVGNTNGWGFAPKQFAGHPKANGFKVKDFSEAMQRLLDASVIRIEVIGPPSKRVSSLVLA